MAAKILMVLSASTIFTLGVVHLVYTFWGPKLTPRDPALQISMSQISPLITSETTMWRCWVGFNASHSTGLILFGLVFGFLALAHGRLLFQSPFLLIVGLAMLAGFVVLSKVYFFSVPLAGISISLACYVASIALSRVHTPNAAKYCILPRLQHLPPLSIQMMSPYPGPSSNSPVGYVQEMRIAVSLFPGSLSDLSLKQMVRQNLPPFRIRKQRCLLIPRAETQKGLQ